MSDTQKIASLLCSEEPANWHLVKAMSKYVLVEVLWLVWEDYINKMRLHMKKVGSKMLEIKLEKEQKGKQVIYTSIFWAAYVVFLPSVPQIFSYKPFFISADIERLELKHGFARSENPTFRNDWNDVLRWNEVLRKANAISEQSSIADMPDIDDKPLDDYCEFWRDFMSKVSVYWRQVLVQYALDLADFLHNKKGSQ